MNAIIDLLERVFWAFAAAFFGSLVASPVFSNLGLGWQDALKVALFTGGAQAIIVLSAYAKSQDSGGSVTGVVEVKPDPSQ